MPILVVVDPTNSQNRAYPTVLSAFKCGSTKRGRPEKIEEGDAASLSLCGIDIFFPKTAQDEVDGLVAFVRALAWRFPETDVHCSVQANLGHEASFLTRAILFDCCAGVEIYSTPRMTLDLSKAARDKMERDLAFWIDDSCVLRGIFEGKNETEVEVAEFRDCYGNVCKKNHGVLHKITGGADRCELCAVRTAIVDAVAVLLVGPD